MPKYYLKIIEKIYPMKKILILSCVLAYGWIVQAQQTSEWNYPILPGTEEWKKFKTQQEKVDACQIPEDVLKAISTNDLVQLCLDYPLLFGFNVFNQISDGVNAVYSSFNGFRELVKRPNAVDILTELYKTELEKQTEILNNNVVSLLVKGKYKSRISAIEIFIGCPQMQNHLTRIEQKQTMVNLMEGYKKKYESLTENNRKEFESNIYARANVINAIDSSLLSTPEMKQLIHSVGTLPEPIECLDTISNQLIQQ